MSAIEQTATSTQTRRTFGSLAFASVLLTLPGGCSNESEPVDSDKSAASSSDQQPGDSIKLERGSMIVTGIERFSPDESVDAKATAAGGEPGDPAFLAPVVGAASPETPQLDLALSYVRVHLQHQQGFVAAMLLNGQQGEVAVYSQWRVDGPAPTTFPAEWSVSEALADGSVKRIDARTFVVDFTAPGDGITITPSMSPRAHFGVFMMEPGVQEQLLEKARETAPGSIGTPGLNAISFHRSLDGGEVINLGAWTDFGGLAELLARPGFTGGNEYWLGLANFHNVWFDVAAVVTAP